MDEMQKLSRVSFGKRVTSIVLSSLLLTASLTNIGGISSFADDSLPKNSEESSSQNQAQVSVDYGLMDNIQDGTILHCFDWKYTDIIEELPNIAAAGFTSVQTSPAQPGGGIDTNIWYWLYQPLGFYAGTNDLGTKEELQELCTEADKYGIKVIVDVVSNHLSGDHTYIQNDLQSSEYWREDKTYSGRQKDIYGNIGMPDIKSENQYVQTVIKNYIQDLKSLGVDGIRWDTAKHIQLPSDDECDFWQEVIDPTMYNYGEILGSPSGNDGDAKMKEYTNYMSITDDVYSRDLRNAFANGNTINSNGFWTNKEISANKIVYWGESHDTWANNKDYGYSNEMPQNVIDRAYAIAAARKDSTALYYSRPEYTYKESILAGAKGSTHFVSAEVAAINHFHNAMVGQNEYCVYKGPNDFTKYYVQAVCREKGAVIAVGAGGNYEVNIKNGSGTTTAGTYIDEITGNVWTVTTGENGRITGEVGETGIAVLYQKSEYQGNVSASPSAGTSFNTNTLTVTLNTSGDITNTRYTTSEGESGSYTKNQQITIGSQTEVGKEVSVTLTGTKKDNTQTSITYKYKKLAPECVKVYFDNSKYNWSKVYAYIYTNNTGTTNANAEWPGVEMTEKDEHDYYVLDVEDYKNIGRIIFSDGASQTENRYPADGTPGMNISAESMILTKKGSKNDVVVWDKYAQNMTTDEGSVSVQAESEIFADTLSVTLNAEAVTNPIYMTSEGDNGSYTDGQVITIGSKTTNGEIKVAVRGLKSDGTIISQVYTYTKEDPNVETIKAYFDNSSYNWSTVYAYIYNSASDQYIAWPGTVMTYNSLNNLYEITIPGKYVNGKIIFTESSKATTNRYPADGEAGLEIGSISKIFSANHQWEEYIEEPVSGSVTASVATGTAFTDTLTVTLYSSEVINAFYQINNNTPVSYENGTSITVGSDISAGKSVTLTLTGRTSDNTTITKTYTYQKGIKIYFDNSSYNWKQVYVYIWDDSTGAIADFPGKLMTYNSETGLYEFIVTDGLISAGYVIFVESYDSQSQTSTNRYPAKGADGQSQKISINGKSKILLENYNWIESSGKLTKIAAKAATCTEDGNIEYYISPEGNYYTLNNNDEYISATAESVVLSKLNHQYGTPSYTWSEDNLSCTATVTCQNDSSHTITETATVTSKVTTAATCEEKGTTTYTATFTNELFAAQTKDVQDIPAVNHQYGTPSYTWSEDNQTCTATVTCENDANHVVTETVNMTATVKTEATCETKGTTTYTATFTNNLFATQTKDVQDIPAKGHSYGDPVWTWDSDYSSATAKFTCSKCNTEQLITAIVTSSTTDATYEAEGKTVYTAIATLNGKDYIDTKEVVIPKKEQEKKYIDISKAQLTLTSSVYNQGQLFKTELTSVELNGKTLVKDTDYVVSGTFSAEDVGTYTITVTGIGDYTGTASKLWAIARMYSITTEIDEDIQSKGYNQYEIVTVTAPAKEGKVFSYWQEKTTGEIVSYNAEYSFYVTRAVTLQAVYADESVTVNKVPYINLTGAYAFRDGTKNNVRYEFTRSVPDNYSLVSHGVLYGLSVKTFNKENAKDTLQFSNADGIELKQNVKQSIGTSTADDGLDRFTINVGTRTEGIVHARGYVVVKDAENKIQVIYSDVISESFASLKSQSEE